MYQYIFHSTEYDEQKKELLRVRQHNDELQQKCENEEQKARELDAIKTQLDQELRELEHSYARKVAAVAERADASEYLAPTTKKKKKEIEKKNWPKLTALQWNANCTTRRLRNVNWSAAYSAFTRVKHALCSRQCARRRRRS